MKVSNQLFFSFKSGFLILTSALLILCACQSRSNGDETQEARGKPTPGENLKPEDIRPAASAGYGKWYNDDPKALREELAGYLAEVQDFHIDNIIGLISPHAGYTYSGPVAAYAYKLLQGKQYDVVVVVAPSHLEAFPFASVYGRGGYETPFGVVPVDVETAHQIADACESARISDTGHRQEHLVRWEHSLEIQLPFLQVVLGDFRLVPILMGNQSPENVHALADALASVLAGKNALLVGSTDLSHFHPYEEANRIDAGVVEHVGKYDWNGLLSDLESGKVEACGGGPMCVVLEASEKLGATHSRVLRYANSFDTSGERKHSVVGYLAAALYK